MNSYNFQNIIDGNAISISLTGMLIVFCSLLLISVYIGLLPKILDLLIPKKKDEKGSVSTEIPSAPGTAPALSVPDFADTDIASVIGLVLHLEQQRLQPPVIEQITLTRNTGLHSRWAASGKMRTMPPRRTHA